jgi:predicted PurR-regulated permease PerM
MVKPEAVRKAQRSAPEGERRGWPTRDILRTLAVIAGFYIALQLLWVGKSVVLLTFLGVLFGIALTAGVDWLERRRVPRGIGAVLLVLAFLGVLVGIGAATAPSITGQLRELQTQLPEAIGKIQRWVQERQEGVTQVLEQVRPDAAPEGEVRAAQDTTAGQAGDRPAAGERGQAPAQGQANQGEGTSPSARQSVAEQIGGVARHLFGFFSSTLAVLGGMVLILFVAIFVAIDARTYQDGLMHLFPHEARPRAREVLGATAVMLRRWLLTQFIGMLVIGVFTAGTLLLLGVKAAIALGIIAGILEFIPIAGPILSAIPAIAMGFLDGPEKALYVAVAYIAIQQVESNVLYPLLMKKGLEIPPVLTIFTQGVLSIVFGFVGLLVAVPMLAAAIVPIKMLYVRDVVGDEVKLPGEEDGKDGKDGKDGEDGEDGDVRR